MSSTRLGRAAARACARRRPDLARARGSRRRAARADSSARRWKSGRFLRLAVDAAAALSRCTSAARPQGHQARQYSRELRQRAGCGYWLWNRITTAARTTGGRTAGNDRRHTRLHGAGTDWANESVDQFPQRPLLARRHVLSDAHRRSCPSALRSDGMGALPCRETAGAAGESRAKRSRLRSPTSS